MSLVFVDLFFASVLLSSLLTWYLRDFALARGWAVGPASSRHVHTRPIPRLGGLAVVTAFLLIAGTFLIACRVGHLWRGFSLHTFAYLVAPAIPVFLVGLYDDFRGVKPFVKFGVQILAATMLFAGGFRVDAVKLIFGNHPLGTVASLALTIFWVLAVTNAFNLLDGLDGLAAGSALFSTVVVFVVSLVSWNGLTSLLALCLSGAILGFLRYNFNPATVFLGDCGSLFIGFMLSAISLAGVQKAPTLIAVAIPVISFGLPILDTTLAVLRRFISGKPLFHPDREHIHHKLMERGFSHRQVVVLLYAVSGVLGLMSLLLLHPAGATVGVVLTVVGVGIWLGVQHLGYHEFIELGRVAQRTLAQRSIIVNNLAIRRAVEQLRSCNDLTQMIAILDAAFSDNDFDEFLLTMAHVRTCNPALDLAGPNGNETCYRWINPATTDAPRHGVLRIQLDLVSATGTNEGSFTLFRHNSEDPLMVDVNLLTTSGFARVVADTLVRVVNQPLPAQSPATVSAAAGGAIS